MYCFIIKIIINIIIKAPKPEVAEEDNNKYNNQGSWTRRSGGGCSNIWSQKTSKVKSSSATNFKVFFWFTDMLCVFLTPVILFVHPRHAEFNEVIVYREMMYTDPSLISKAINYTESVLHICFNKLIQY